MVLIIQPFIVLYEFLNSRWMEVIGNATQHSGRHRLFSRKDSAHLDIDVARD